MPLFSDAFASLRRNPGPVSAYVGFALLWGLLNSGLIRILFPDMGPETKTLPPGWHAYHLIATILSCAASAAVAAVCFARMGKEMDRPLWKSAGDWDALQRFFMPWLILYLACEMLHRVAASLLESGREEAGICCLFVFMLCFVLAIPVGTCVMYSGGLYWHALHENLRPIAAMFPLMLNVFSVAFLEFVLLVAAMLLAKPFQDVLLYWPLVNGILSAVECLIFALMWRICMIHRDLPPDTDLDDLDF